MRNKRALYDYTFFRIENSVHLKFIGIVTSIFAFGLSTANIERTIVHVGDDTHIKFKIINSKTLIQVTTFQSL